MRTRFLGWLEQFFTHLVWCHSGGEPDERSFLPSSERCRQVEYGVVTGEGKGLIDEVGIQPERQQFGTVCCDDCRGVVLCQGGGGMRGVSVAPGGRGGSVVGRCSRCDFGDSIDRVSSELDVRSYFVGLVVVASAASDITMALGMTAGEGHHG